MKKFLGQLLLLFFLSIQAFAVAPASPDGPASDETPCEVASAFVTPRSQLVMNFLKLKPLELFQSVLDLNSDLRWLQRKVEISVEDAAVTPRADSPSRLLFNDLFHPEVDRTLVSILALQQILKGDFAAFTGPQQVLPEPARLTQRSFDELRALFFRILGTDPSYVYQQGIPVGVNALEFIDGEKLDALITHMVIHDLGKSKSFGVLARAVTVAPAVDHDDILVRGVLGEDMLSHSFARLSQFWKGRILRGMSSAVNIPQFVQLENLPFNMAGLRDMDRDDFEFYYLHAFLDVAGSTALTNPTGSFVMMEGVYQSYKLAFEKMLEHYDSGVSAAQVYENFILAKAKLLGIDMREEPEDYAKDRALVRLAVLNRCGNAKCVAQVQAALASLPISFQELLVRELNMKGHEGWGILPYYTPGLFVNAKAGMKKIDRTDDDAIRLALMTLARSLLATRIHLRKIPGDGVFTTALTEIARLAKTDPRTLETSDFSFENATSLGGDLLPKPFIPFNADALPTQHSLKNLPGNNFVVIGIGSGSDSVQARILEILLQRAGKATLGTVAVHPQRSESGSPDSPIRTLENHLGLVGQDSYIVGESTTATQMDRFLEPLLAGETPVFVTWERREPGRLEDQLKVLLQHIAAERGIGVRDLHVLAVDTGGDCLETAGGLDLAVASPDQDIRVLRALAAATKTLGSRLTTAVVAPGIDGPRNFIDSLKSAGATFHAFDEVESAEALSIYQRLQLDGTHPQRFGKTPFALQNALRKEFGVQIVPLPSRLILSFSNPWNNAVFVEPGMAGVLFIEGGAHLKLLQGAK